MARAEEDSTEDEAPEGGGRGRKLLIIGGIALVLLLGGGAASYFLLAGDEPADAETAEAEVEDEPEGEPVYHAMAPKFIVNLPPGGQAKMMQLSIQVFTRREPVLEFLQKHDPMLRHHIFDVLSGADGDSLYTRDGREALQKQLQAELERKMRDNGLQQAVIDGVYFTEFVLQ